MRPPLHPLRSAVLLLALLALTGCTTLQPVAADPAAAEEGKKFTVSGDGPPTALALKFANRPLCAVLTITRPSAPHTSAWIASLSI